MLIFIRGKCKVILRLSAFHLGRGWYKSCKYIIVLGIVSWLLKNSGWIRIYGGRNIDNKTTFFDSYVNFPFSFT